MERLSLHRGHGTQSASSGGAQTVARHVQSRVRGDVLRGDGGEGPDRHPRCAARRFQGAFRVRSVFLPFVLCKWWSYVQTKLYRVAAMLRCTFLPGRYTIRADNLRNATE